MVASVDPLNLQPGQMVDVWRIVRCIGRGGYAVVYEVEKDGQRYALKVACQTERSQDPRQTDARARREVACLQQLQHRHIIRMWAHGRWPDSRSGVLYIVLDFVDGCTLAQWVERTHPTPHEVVVLFLKLFDALEHIHSRNMFHRDLSLRNILVTREGEPVIIDFGAADYATADELTDGPLPPGTPRIRSPEAQRFWRAHQLDPQARYTFKATDDIFALGADLYDVLTDPLPTRGERRPPLGHAVMEPPTPHQATQGRVPQELSRYAMTLIHRDPEERPQTAKDARRPLEEFARFTGEDWRGTPVHPIASQLPPEPSEAAAAPVEEAPLPLRRPWRRPVIAGGLALGILAAAVTVLLHTPATPPPPAAPAGAEKPTSRPAPLPLLLPTQQEAHPSVKQPDNSPTLTRGAPPPPQTQKPQPRSRLSKLERCALLVASAAWLQAGCSGVQTRPEPGDCPEEAIRAMKALGWVLDIDYKTPTVMIDVTRPHPKKVGIAQTEENAVMEVKDGPVTGSLVFPFGKAPEDMRLDGHLWTTGDRVYGHYVRAHLPDGSTVPVCIELRSGFEVGLEKNPGSKPGHAIIDKVVDARAVTRWR
ncbi:serine/threonine protein kinase [Hyalangium minutum]|uniref:Protein kinase domain-containing protein n=1 Tax=Hyalangium minutum TaxID=394096 RepID=A0A085VZR3_9BACT|nr:serine/threonine-protein kinase [Hyalangium minutum]KFE60926.1 hypothetical protein DB31_4550 [Hyalangium minutum]